MALSRFLYHWSSFKPEVSLSQMTGSKAPSSEVQHWMPVFVLIPAGLLSTVIPLLGRLEHQAAV